MARNIFIHDSLSNCEYFLYIHCHFTDFNSKEFHRALRSGAIMRLEIT